VKFEWSRWVKRSRRVTTREDEQLKAALRQQAEDLQRLVERAIDLQTQVVGRLDEVPRRLT
jgi:hypothetical protein